MHIVNFPCPRCAVEHTMRRSDGRPLCINCLLRRRSTRADASPERSGTPNAASQSGYPPGSAA